MSAGPCGASSSAYGAPAGSSRRRRRHFRHACCHLRSRSQPNVTYIGQAPLRQERGAEVSLVLLHDTCTGSWPLGAGRAYPWPVSAGSPDGQRPRQRAAGAAARVITWPMAYDAPGGGV
eukprot:6809127-Prymnesium_polylepis.1